MSLDIKPAEELVDRELEARRAARRRGPQAEVLRWVLRTFAARGGPVTVGEVEAASSSAHGSSEGFSKEANDELPTRDSLLILDLTVLPRDEKASLDRFSAASLRRAAASPTGDCRSRRCRLPV